MLLSGRELIQCIQLDDKTIKAGQLPELNAGIHH